MTKILCHECFYFEPMTDGPLGYCHFTAPVIVPMKKHLSGLFPIVSESNWCGEAVAREEPEPREIFQSQDAQ